MYTCEFSVSGRGWFPTDMLRYDQCFPVSSEDCMLLSDGGDRTVALKRYTLAKHGCNPTVKRWESFGWAVTYQQEPRKV